MKKKIEEKQRKYKINILVDHKPVVYKSCISWTTKYIDPKVPNLTWEWVLHELQVHTLIEIILNS